VQGPRPGGLAFPRGLLATDTPAAARSLLGAGLVRIDGSCVRIGRIVEVEAYVGTGDLASHARVGRTDRNAVMFGPPGHAYVYLVYGMYCCLNVVTEIEGRPAALLIRAVQPLEGVAEMRHARLEAELSRTANAAPERAAATRKRVAALPADRLASGPGLVCAAFSIGRSDNLVDLCDPAAPLHLAPRPEAASISPSIDVGTGPRIGIGYAPEPWLSMPWRFWIAGNVAVSGARRIAAPTGSHGR
jgi:DNA-3-methyladenine glycosylase